METVDQLRFAHNYALEPSTGCWLWTGAIARNGYAAFNVAGRKRIAHRVAYELHVGPIPEGLEIDHLCRTRHCVNPAHLEAVTRRENVLRSGSWAARHARASHCPAGHPYDEANTLTTAAGSRRCRVCRQAQNRASESRRAPRVRSRTA